MKNHDCIKIGYYCDKYVDKHENEPYIAMVTWVFSLMYNYNKGDIVHEEKLGD